MKKIPKFIKIGKHRLKIATINLYEYNKAINEDRHGVRVKLSGEKMYKTLWTDSKDAAIQVINILDRLLLDDAQLN